MPTSMLVNHFSQNIFDILIGRLCSSVHLGMISGWVSVSNLKLLTCISDQVTIEIWTIVGNNGFWYSKPAYQIVANKINYSFLGYRLLWSRFHPLGEVINGNQNESVSIRSGWLYQPKDIHAPSYKWSRWTHSIELVRWHSDQISVHLTFMTFLHKLATIILHGHPEIPGS